MIGESGKSDFSSGRWIKELPKMEADYDFITIDGSRVFLRHRVFANRF